MSVGWGIIGTGGIAGRMATALQQADGAKLVAACGTSHEKAQDFVSRFGGHGYAELAALLDDAAVEIVYVASPTHLHAEQAIAAAQAGKHVLVEKPMALTTEEAMAMAEAAREAGVRLGVGFHLRYHPVHRAMRELIVSGELGGVVLAQALWGFYSADWPRDSWKMDPQRAGSGSLAALGVHMIDLLRFLVGREVTAVAAFSDGPEQGFPVEFLTAAVLRFEGGAIAELVSSRRLDYTDDDVTVYLDAARLRGAGTVSTEPVGVLELRTADGEEVRELPLRDLYALEAEACSAAVREGRDFDASAGDGVASTVILQALLESARSGQSVATTPPA